MYRVNLSLRTQQQMGDELPEVIDQQFEAWLRPVSDGVILYYDENLTEDGQTTNAELHISADRVVLKRIGGQVMEMRFRLGEPYDLLYDTPYGQFPLKINTRQIILTELVLPEGSCNLNYELAFEGQPMLNHQLDVTWLMPEL